MHTEKLCLVIMPFRKELQEIYKYAIRPAVTESGYRCIRVDELVGPINITKTVIEFIFKADVIIADLTENNPNVFYELGVAHTIANKTVMITQDIENVPFDIKIYRTIKYDQTIEGAQRLRKDLLNELKNIDDWKEISTNPVQDFGAPLLQNGINELFYTRADAPVVVKTVPEPGATDVDPALVEISVTFNKKMSPNSWSWCSISEHTYPKTLAEPYYLEDNRTCVLKVKLEPDQSYVIWLNMPKYVGFRDWAGNPAVPYLLTFKTRK